MCASASRSYSGVNELGGLVEPHGRSFKSCIRWRRTEVAVAAGAFGDPKQLPRLQRSIEGLSLRGVACSLGSQP